MTRDEAIIEVTRQHAMNIVQARSGWGAAGDLQHLNPSRIIADAERLMATGSLPPRPTVSDWRDDARQPMQVIMSTADTIKVCVERGIGGPELDDSVALLERNVERLDRALAVLDAAYPLIGRRDANEYVGKLDPFDADDLTRLATQIRDQCRHAAICAPAHGERPDEAIDRINVNDFVRAMWDE